MTNSPFEVYCYFTALKSHFNSNYDFIKYNGKMRLTKDAFEQRNDKYFYYKLSKKKDWKNFILANLVKNKSIWVGNLINDANCDKVYSNWLKISESLSYIFRNELSSFDTYNEMVKVKNQNELPPILREYISGRLSIETLIILDDLVKIFSYFDEKINDKLIYPDINRIAIKYKPFLSYDKKEMKRILIDLFKP